MTAALTTHEGPVTLVVKVARTEFDTVVLNVDKQSGEDAADLVARYDTEISGHLPWSDWDLIEAEVRA